MRQWREGRVKDQCAFFDLGRFLWSRGPAHVEGDFQGEPRWAALVGSRDGCQLLAHARDWPELPLMGPQDAPEWRQHGGVLVRDAAAPKGGTSRGEGGRRGTYPAYGEIPAAKPPLYQQFADVPPGHEGAIRAFARRWGLPLRTDRDGRESCPVLVFQYHSHLLMLTLGLLTEVQRGERDLYRSGAPLPRLFEFWRLGGVGGSSRHMEATMQRLTADLQAMQHGEVLADVDTASRRAGGLVQEIFCHQLSGGFPWRIAQGSTDESDSGLQYDPDAGGCRPVVQLDVTASGRVTAGPGWACGSLLQRIWLEAYKHLADAVVTQCACGCRTWEWLTGNRRDKFLKKDQRIWSKGHRSRVVNAEARDRMTAKEREAYRAAGKERARASRQRQKAQKQ
jgi:hypothetical protein